MFTWTFFFSFCKPFVYHESVTRRLVYWSVWPIVLKYAKNSRSRESAFSRLHCGLKFALGCALRICLTSCHFSSLTRIHIQQNTIFCTFSDISATYTQYWFISTGFKTSQALYIIWRNVVQLHIFEKLVVFS